MTPGEIKGYLNQLLRSSHPSNEQKQALRLALEAIDAILIISPHFYKAAKEIEGAGSSSEFIDSNEYRRSDPNTGWPG